ncbi:MAG: MCP four helix bundle domain-containing protein [Limisphaerales bacterium]
MNAEALYPAIPAAEPRSRRPGRVAMALLALLTALLFTLGVIGWWRLAGIDARYSRTLEQTAASLKTLHEISLHIFGGYSHIVELRQTQNPDDRAALLRVIRAERAANDRLFASLQQTLTDPAQRTALEQVLGKRAVCHAQADVLLAAPAPGEEAATSLELLRSYLAYQQACDQLSDRIQTAALEINRALTREITGLRWLFLGVGLLPIACAILFLVVILSLLRVINVQGEED